MKKEEAIRRIKEFGLYHAIGDLPNSAKTVEAFNMAIEALQTDIVYCYECKYDGSCCQCVDIIDDLLSLNFCGRGERKETEE